MSETIDELVERVARAALAAWLASPNIGTWSAIARAAIAECYRWRPIEEARKDGTPIIAWLRSGNVVSAAWVDYISDGLKYGGWYQRIGGAIHRIYPTHFRPLGPGPEEGK